LVQDFEYGNTATGFGHFVIHRSPCGGGGSRVYHRVLWRLSALARIKVNDRLTLPGTQRHGSHRTSI